MRPVLAAVVLASSLCLPAAAAAADTDAIRAYLGVRLGAGILLDPGVRPGMEGSRVEQLVGVTVGVNLGQHLGVELAGDGYEIDLGVHGLPRGKTVGEYAIYTVVPQVRVRYPLLDSRLTPYGVAGVGVGFNEFNDRKEPAFAIDVGGETWAVVGVVGTGLEYFVANNIAVGVEGKYLISRGHEIRLNERESSVNLDSMLLSVGLRIFFP